ncbi:MAG: hypothetical protein ACREQ4_17170 [Candidatus Binataceae bacterium]
MKRRTIERALAMFRVKRTVRNLVIAGTTLLAIGGIAFAAGFGPLLPIPVSTSPSNGDLNPYGVQFIPNRFSPLRPGDVLVSNFNNSSNQMGTGTTIVDIRNGQRSLFYQNASIPGFDLALVLLKAGFIVVGNVPETYPSLTTMTPSAIGPGQLTFLSPAGTLVMSLTDNTGKFINQPWGMTTGNDRGSSVQLFVSNLNNVLVNTTGFVSRIDLSINRKTGITVTNKVVIGAGYLNSTGPTGPAGLFYNQKTDTLYVASQNDNEIFAIPNAGHISTTQTTPGTAIFNDQTHLHGPTGLIMAPNGDLITANFDGVNASTAAPFSFSELTEFTPGGQFVTQFSIDPNMGSAFGLGLQLQGSAFKLAYVDDTLATLSILPFAK